MSMDLSELIEFEATNWFLLASKQMAEFGLNGAHWIFLSLSLLKSDEFLFIFLTGVVYR